MKEERNEGTKKRANVYKCSSMLQWHVFDILVTRPFRFSNGNMRSRSPISNFVLIMLSLSQDIDFPRYGQLYGSTASGKVNRKASLGLPTYTCIFPWSVYFCDQKDD